MAVSPQTKKQGTADALPGMACDSQWQQETNDGSPFGETPERLLPIERSQFSLGGVVDDSMF
jgi:hypothetical protein